MTVLDVNTLLEKIQISIEACKLRIPRDAFRGQEPLASVVDCLNECAAVLQQIKVDI